MTRARQGVTPQALEVAARAAVPRGHLPAVGGPRVVPLGVLSWTALVDMAGADPAGVVIGAPLQVTATVSGTSFPRLTAVRRGRAGAIALLPGDRVETFGTRARAVLVLPYLRDPDKRPRPWPNMAELQEPMAFPGGLVGSFTPEWQR